MPIGGRGARDARLGLLGSPLSPGFSECVLGFAWLGRGGGLQKEKRGRWAGPLRTLVVL